MSQKDDNRGLDSSGAVSSLKRVGLKLSKAQAFSGCSCGCHPHLHGSSSLGSRWEEGLNGERGPWQRGGATARGAHARWESQAYT